MRDIEKRSQDREVRLLEQVSEDQLREKQDIFQKYLPDSLMTMLNEDMAEEDRKQMKVLREQLEKQNAERLAEMDAQ